MTPNLGDVALAHRDASGDVLLSAFLAHAQASGLTLYAAQEEAILELEGGSNVILNTPTGSGKSLVAEAAHFYALARGQRTFYTAPIKALVSEKFFALCRTFGAERVGMMTGDATVNRDAPILCCTAEILANLALLDGKEAAVQQVVMDEFHYYGDKERGVAWQIPLLALPQVQFLLMSATLGDTAFFEEQLTTLTGRRTVLVQSKDRPVPLEYTYRETPIHESIAELVTAGKAPAYVVHFTQRAAAEQAQNLLSVDILTKDQKNAIKAELGDFRFDSPFGKELKRFVHHGVGVHHAGMLPKYRLMIEKLTQKGLLKIICGTDTLGVGVNVPIRSVLFTQLCKYDGTETRVLRVREFQQIAGRAGRRGYDDQGHVWAQAPEHVIENIQIEKKAAGDPGKAKKLVRRKPPEKGYAHWDRSTFERLVGGQPEQLTSNFRVSHAMVLSMLERREGGCGALRDLIRSAHETPKSRRRHGLRALAILRALLNADVLERVTHDDGRVTLRVHGDLQADFSLHQALSPFVVHVMGLLDVNDPDYALSVLSVVESTLENPEEVLRRQTDRLKDEAMAEMKANGVEYEERIRELEKIEHPKPLRDFIYDNFNAFAKTQPWITDENIRPKSVAREMFEFGATFNDYVREYGLGRSEGALLRYLTDAYKAFVQSVPEASKTDEVYELTDWLGAVVRQVDSSLIDEWEKLRDGVATADLLAEATPALPKEKDITEDVRVFTALVRNEAFRFVRMVSQKNSEEALAGLKEQPGWNRAALVEAMAPFFTEHGHLRADPEARRAEHVRFDRDTTPWTVTQVLLDPAGNHDWYVRFTVDREASKQEGRAVLALDHIGT